MNRLWNWAGGPLSHRSRSRKTRRTAYYERNVTIFAKERRKIKMREIIFRGQTRKHGEKVSTGGKKLPGNWVYGGIFPGTGDFSVIYGWKATDEQTGSNLEKFAVYSDTIGQYTGRDDDNGRKIFEGDIIRIFLPVTGHDPIVVISEVYFSDGCFCVNWGEKLRAQTRTRIDSIVPGATLEVIGNIYDNRELLEADS